MWCSAGYAPVRHIRAQAEVLLNHTAAGGKCGKEVAERYHEDQNPELEVDEYTEQDQMTDNNKPSIVAHLFSSFVSRRKQRIPEKEVNISFTKEMGNVWKHNYLEPIGVKKKPASIAQPGKVNRFKHNFLIEPFV
jgi:hypothetical protein